MTQSWRKSSVLAKGLYCSKGDYFLTLLLELKNIIRKFFYMKNFMNIEARKRILNYQEILAPNSMA